MSRIHLRTRVLWLTGAFAFALAAITFGLTWQAKRSQERWMQLLRVETGAVSMLDEFIRTQNGFRTRMAGGDEKAAARYSAVKQLLEVEPLKAIDTTALRVRVRSFEMLLRAGAPAGELNAESARIVTEANRLKSVHHAVIQRQLPRLESESDNMTRVGFSVAWIIAMIALAVATLTNHKVVRPLESLSLTAKRIAAGDLSQRAVMAGDKESAELAEAFNLMAETLQKSARTDELTGLPNFRAFSERIDTDIERAIRYGERFGMLILDLDRFKKYNDTYGHQAGNETLQRVARALRESIRVVDFPARYGGEEFAVIAPQVDAEALARVAERIRAAVEAMPAPPTGTAVTVSIGAAIYPFDGNSVEALFHRADERLYQAKREGRNRVVVTSTPAAQSAG